jgi:hypothetical protein
MQCFVFNGPWQFLDLTNLACFITLLRRKEKSGGIQLEYHLMAIILVLDLCLKRLSLMTVAFQAVWMIVQVRKLNFMIMQNEEAHEHSFMEQLGTLSMNFLK